MRERTRTPAETLDLRLLAVQGRGGITFGPHFSDDCKDLVRTPDAASPPPLPSACTLSVPPCNSAGIRASPGADVAQSAMRGWTAQILKFLRPNPQLRLGALKNGARDVKAHPWFKARSHATPPSRPSVRPPARPAVAVERT